MLVSGAQALKASRQVSEAEPVVLTAPPARFVSRGGIKLEAALDEFGLNPTGVQCLDVGSSTGGFTDCLLQRGAREVVAIDVGVGQLHERLRSDQRVRSYERLHVRDVAMSAAGGKYSLIVVDVSFISLTAITAYLLELVAGQGDLVLLVKPQFEAGRQVVSKGRGIVRDRRVWSDVLITVAEHLAAHGAAVMGVIPSPITGAQGNVEFLMWARVAAVPPAPIEVLVEAALARLAIIEPDTGGS